MDETPCAATATIRPSVSGDSDGIARAFLESATYHASFDPERYSVPAFDTIRERYRGGRQHPVDAQGKTITLVADLDGEVVGFVDARLERSLDVMHRELIYCHVSEIAVISRRQHQGIGGRLLRAVEDWGRSEGANFVSLEYHVANMSAGEFYQRRMGYRVAAITAIKPL